MKKTTDLFCVFIISFLGISHGQITNNLTIDTAIAVKFKTDSGKAYMVEESDDLILWHDALLDWIVGDGQTNTSFSEITNTSQYFRYRSAVRPTVLETDPASGSTNVDHMISQIVIRFPEDMGTTVSLGSATSEGVVPTWITGTHWQDSRTHVRACALETNTQYAFWINPVTGSPKTKTSEGIPVMPYLIKFKTQ